ncbi:MAG: hypothetical protein HQK73_04855 [Desulfamplus sp.]|nr:hypothetical protein [Desulfamplus sp.]MBF0412121.1 hypothetical protein [Desulfamplus sp.]
MNRIFKIFLCSMLFYVFAASHSWSADAVEQKKEVVKTASVFFPEPAYQFASIVDGVEVIHDFVIMNKGTDTLQVQKVKTG